MIRINYLIGFAALVLQLANCSDPSAVEESGFPGYEAYAWEESTPSQHGLDSVKIGTGLAVASTQSFIHSMLIIKDGYLVAERYYRGYQKDEPHIVRSVSKSFLSALVGVALREGFINSTETKISEYLPECLNEDCDEEFENMTIKHLLTMRGGIKKDREFYMEAFGSDNWLNTILSEPLTDAPGSSYGYSTPATHLLNIVLTKATGTSSLEFAHKFLFEPMKIEIGDWEKDPQGYYFGGNNMFFAPRDMAMLGMLYLHNGKLHSEQIIPQKWVENSLTNTRNEQDVTWGDMTDIGYGYLWWLGKIRGHKTFAAIGHGGQFVLVLPEVDMIVATTADGYVDWDDADRHERLIIQIIADYFIEAII